MSYFSLSLFTAGRRRVRERAEALRERAEALRERAEAERETLLEARAQIEAQRRACGRSAESGQVEFLRRLGDSIVDVRVSGLVVAEDNCEPTLIVACPSYVARAEAVSMLRAVLAMRAEDLRSVREEFGRGG